MKKFTENDYFMGNYKKARSSLLLKLCSRVMFGLLCQKFVKTIFKIIIIAQLCFSNEHYASI